MNKIRMITDWRDIMEGDTIIIQRRDNSLSDGAFWNILIGQRLTILELMDCCEDDYCFHTMKVKMTNGDEVEVEVDENHDGMMEHTTIFR